MRRVLLVVLAIIGFLSIAHGQTQNIQNPEPNRALNGNCAFVSHCFAEWDESDPLGARIPLVLIHGWNSKGVPGPPGADSQLFGPFIIQYLNDAQLQARYKLYFYSYYSNETSVNGLVAGLRVDLAAKDLQDRAFNGRPIVILAHSLGGLIGSAYMFDGSRTALLITLGTPHHGSPLANGPARDAKTLGLWSFAQTLFDELYFSVVGPDWSMPNRSELRWDNYDGRLDYGRYPSERNTLLEELNPVTSWDRQIIGYAGNYAPAGDCTFSPFAKFCYGATLLGGAFSMPSDGVVPVSSASFWDSRGVSRIRGQSRVFDGYNHDEIVTGKSDGSLFVSLRSDLLAVETKVSTSAGPFGSFDSPANGSVGAGEVALTGWALDDAGVTSVDLYADGTYIGSPTFISGARPDVERGYSLYPSKSRAGWGYMLMSNFLPNKGNGAYRFTAYANDADGHRTLLGSKTLTFNNSSSTLPFGTIDTPAQGETISGVYTNFGWALSPWPNSIPADGSTIEVYVDGRSIGHPAYNNYRADIAGAFPGLKNSNGAVGYIQIDTRTLTNGTHILGWLVRDSAGNAEGIGSRYFTVKN